MNMKKIIATTITLCACLFITDLIADPIHPGFCSVDESSPTALDTSCETGDYPDHSGGQAGAFFTYPTEGKVVCSVTNKSTKAITYYLNYYTGATDHPQSINIPANETKSFKAIDGSQQYDPWINIYTDQYKFPSTFPSATLICHSQ